MSANKYIILLYNLQTDFLFKLLDCVCSSKHTCSCQCVILCFRANASCQTAFTAQHSVRWPHSISVFLLQVNLRKRRTGFPNWSSWTLWALCAAWTWFSTRRIWSKWSSCCLRLLAGICVCPPQPTLSTTTSTPQSRRATSTTAGPSLPSQRPRLSWTNTLTTFWKSHCKVGYQEEGELDFFFFFFQMCWILICYCLWVLLDHAFLSFRPSQVAAACVAASRICLQISPSWTTALHLLTGYTWDHLTQCIELMLL